VFPPEQAQHAKAIQQTPRWVHPPTLKEGQKNSSQKGVRRQKGEDRRMSDSYPMCPAQFSALVVCRSVRAHRPESLSFRVGPRDTAKPSAKEGERWGSDDEIDSRIRRSSAGEKGLGSEDIPIEYPTCASTRMEAAAFHFVASVHQTKERQPDKAILARKMVHLPLDFVIT